MSAQHHKTLTRLYLPATFMKCALPRLAAKPVPETSMELKRKALLLGLVLLSLLLKEVVIPAEFLEEWLGRWWRR